MNHIINLMQSLIYWFFKLCASYLKQLNYTKKALNKTMNRKKPLLFSANLIIIFLLVNSTPDLIAY